VALIALAAGCATPEYSVRSTPQPDESQWAVEIEQTISAYQAREFDKQGAEPLDRGRRVQGFDVQAVVDRLSRVTERPNLGYRVLMYSAKDPNAAALADGRVYISTGMLQYLASRGSKEDELAFILGHELAHTVAQHLVKRYQQLQKQQMAMALVGLGTAVITRGGGAQAQQLGSAVNDVATLVTNVIASGYSQEQELEADQLGIRYVIRTGYNPWAALNLLEDFKRFDVPGGFLRTHPYIERRAEDLRRFLTEQNPSTRTVPPASSFTRPSTAPAPRPSSTGRPSNDRRKQLLDAQKLYPVGSQSWKNIQSQLDRLR
jgi:predicted Zn-dependent protease